MQKHKPSTYQKYRNSSERSDPKRDQSDSDSDTDEEITLSQLNDNDVRS